MYKYQFILWGDLFFFLLHCLYLTAKVRARLGLTFHVECVVHSVCTIQCIVKDEAGGSPFGVWTHTKKALHLSKRRFSETFQVVLLS